MTDHPAWPVDSDGFRLRGMEMTRTEAFTDAAFAFAVTLLVIATQNVPGSFAELKHALAGVPAFAVSFAVVMLFWYGHWKWSRRYGLEDLPSILLSFALVFVTLIYVYPLKFVYQLFTNSVTGVDNSGSGIRSWAELYQLFAIYGVGYIAMNLVVAALNAHAYRRRHALGLDPVECYLTKVQIRIWAIPAALGALSVALAVATPPSRLLVPAWIYSLMAVLMPWHGARTRRGLEAVRARHGAPAAAEDRVSAAHTAG